MGVFVHEKETDFYCRYKLDSHLVPFTKVSVHLPKSSQSASALNSAVVV